MKAHKMDSRELGLVLGQYALGVEDLHYGLWEADLELNFQNLVKAQARYTEKMLSVLPKPAQGVRVLDIGCGTGHLLSQMLQAGYAADGVIPAEGLQKIVQQRLDKLQNKTSRIFGCRLQEFPVADYRAYYDVALFSESFQYIPMRESFPILEAIVKPGGLVIISDFFKTEHHKDGRPGDRSFGGGHRLSQFYAELQATRLRIQADEDITKLVSPTIDLLNQLLTTKVKPMCEVIDLYLHGNYPKLYWLINRFFRKKMQRVNYKYLSGHRSKEVFERYKSYHFVVCRLQPQ